MKWKHTLIVRVDGYAAAAFGRFDDPGSARAAADGVRKAIVKAGRAGSVEVIPIRVGAVTGVSVLRTFGFEEPP